MAVAASGMQDAAATPIILYECSGASAVRFAWQSSMSDLTSCHIRLSDRHRTRPVYPLSGDRILAGRPVISTLTGTGTEARLLTTWTTSDCERIGFHKGLPLQGIGYWQVVVIGTVHPRF